MTDQEIDAFLREMRIETVRCGELTSEQRSAVTTIALVPDRTRNILNNFHRLLPVKGYEWQDIVLYGRAMGPEDHQLIVDIEQAIVESGLDRARIARFDIQDEA